MDRRKSNDFWGNSFTFYSQCLLFTVVVCNPEKLAGRAKRSHHQRHQHHHRCIVHKIHLSRPSPTRDATFRSNIIETSKINLISIFNIGLKCYTERRRKIEKTACMTRALLRKTASWNKQGSNTSPLQYCIVRPFYGLQVVFIFKRAYVLLCVIYVAYDVKLFIFQSHRFRMKEKCHRNVPEMCSHM